jgi:glyoxylase-like metal-dependent hydrolase (beta-lactamase superfamily II)
MIFEQTRVQGDRNFGYLIGDEGSLLAAIVDAGEAPEKMLDAAEARGLKIAYVISTHSHKDHIVGNAWLVERTGALEALYEGTPHPSPIRIKDNEELVLGALRLRFLFTPGHIPDHVCILVSRAGGPSAGWEGAGASDKLGSSGISAAKLITGDLLFVGKIGGTGPHFPGSDPRQEWDSLHRLIRLGKEDPAIEVWPGHDYGTQPSSTLGREIATNPFLLCKTYDEFIYLKDNWAEYKKAHNIT